MIFTYGINASRFQIIFSFFVKLGQWFIWMSSDFGILVINLQGLLFKINTQERFYKIIAKTRSTGSVLI